MPDTILVSSLGKTWILDLDGTVVKHNGYKLDGEDTFLPGAKKFLQQIPLSDKIFFLTSRPESLASQTEDFLRAHEIRYDMIVYDLPYGERILINDRKPSGLPTAIAVNTDRNRFMEAVFEEDETL